MKGDTAHRKRTELALARHALQRAIEKSNNPSLVLRLSREVQALERKYEMAKQGRNDGQNSNDQA